MSRASARCRSAFSYSPAVVSIRPSPASDEPDAAAVVQLPPQLESALEACPRLGNVPLRQREIPAPDHDVGPTAVVVRLRESLGCLVEQGAGTRELAGRASDPGEIREHVADRGIARDVGERL